MQKIVFTKIKLSLQSVGLIATAIKMINYSINLQKNARFRKNVLFLKSNEDRFTWIYKNNYWSSSESLSGTGSTLKYTFNLRKELPNLFNSYSIETVFDAPCGDFKWMSHLVPFLNIEYIGGDIVKPLVDDLNNKYKSSKISFIHLT